MNCEWKSVKLYEIAEVVDSLHKTPEYVEQGVPMLRVTDIKEGYLSLHSSLKVSLEVYKEFTKKHKPQLGDIVVSRVGTYGVFSYAGTSANFCLGQNTALIIPHINKKFLYYSLISRVTKNYLEKVVTGSTQKTVSLKNIKEIPLFIPNSGTQKKIAKILSALDDKIECNNQINKNLEEQVFAIYRNMFVDHSKSDRNICRIEECFDISIGKTPPRKESQWFSENPNDITWVSISDMGNCGVYINDSSEKLTKKAIQNYNIKIVPDNTVLLSFKLTVGRVAITNGEMTTNEAIAHFKTEKKELNEYLYFYLKTFNYQTMGSTSSIATAVNSKLIKAMPFIVPTEDELIQFHKMVSPMFAEIKAKQVENSNLVNLRDTLLPKLMSGELDVSDIDI